MILSADKCAQIFPYDIPDQVSNNAVIDQQFLCEKSMH